MVDNFLCQGGDYRNIALGTLVQKSLNNSYTLINSTLPLDLTTRQLASDNKADGKTCDTYLTVVTTDASLRAQICGQYDFTIVD